MTFHGNDRFQRKLELRAKKSTEFKILIVDDEPSILELVKTALETLDGYEVFCAGSATEALDIVASEEKPFNCFLLDIQMPDIGGIELLCELRDIQQYVETPILMLTAMSDRKYIDEAFIEGATDYVSKPFDFLELHSRIQRANSMVDLRRRFEKNLECANEMQRKLVSAQEFSVDEPINIKGLTQFLRFVEFDNYVAQLARGKMFGTQALSVIIQGAEVLFEKVGCDNFRSVIEDIAVIIQDEAKDLNCVFSYRGGGVFMVILHNHKDAISQNGNGGLVDVLQAQFAYRVTDPRVSILVGDPVAMRPLFPRAANGALQKSLSLAQKLDRELSKLSRTTHNEMRAHLVHGARQPDQKRVYERVLHELFGEENYRDSP